jgi:hypothetical protein
VKGLAGCIEPEHAKRRVPDLAKLGGVEPDAMNFGDSGKPTRVREPHRILPVRLHLVVAVVLHELLMPEVLTGLRPSPTSCM